ncbi:DUF2971 domain-containing protein [Pseudomonas sp. NPDC077186]|uniref:DUF2971 domain-containing protein n=1 Tax=Pseudomonas sp. NPDC077186 TaxID=3364421 RepID=UPI0037C5A7D0
MKTPNRLYRYRPLSDRDNLLERELSALRDSYLYAPLFEQMNDPMEAFMPMGGDSDHIFDEVVKPLGLKTEDYYDGIRLLIQQFGLVSFSSTHNYLPMWAYYASGFEGMCLEFDSERLAVGDFQNEHLSKVVYKREALPPLTIESVLRVPEDPHVKGELLKRLNRKRIEWKHEKEWRYVTGASGKKHYLDDALTRVYLGPRVKPDHATLVCEVLKNRPVEVMQGEIRGFELHFETLQPAAPLAECERVGSGHFDPLKDLDPDGSLKAFMGEHYEHLLNECNATALRPNMDGFAGAGVSPANQRLMFLWSQFKLRSGRVVYHKRYFDRRFCLAKAPAN